MVKDLRWLLLGEKEKIFWGGGDALLLNLFREGTHMGKKKIKRDRENNLKRRHSQCLSYGGNKISKTSNREKNVLNFEKIRYFAGLFLDEPWMLTVAHHHYVNAAPPLCQCRTTAGAVKKTSLFVKKIFFYFFCKFMQIIYPLALAYLPPPYAGVGRAGAGGGIVL